MMITLQVYLVKFFFQCCPPWFLWPSLFPSPAWCPFCGMCGFQLGAKCKTCCIHGNHLFHTCVLIFSIPALFYVFCHSHPWAKCQPVNNGTKNNGVKKRFFRTPKIYMQGFLTFLFFILLQRVWTDDDQGPSHGKNGSITDVLFKVILLIYSSTLKKPISRKH